MKHRTTVGARRLFAILIAVAVLAPTALADDLGYPPAPPPPPPIPGMAALPVADEPPPAPPAPPEAPVPPADDAAATRDAVVVNLGEEDGVKPGFRYTRRAPCCAPVRSGRRGMWDITVEGSATIFENPTGIIGLTPPAGTPTFDWSQNTLDPAFGARATVGYRPTARDRVEGRVGYAGEASASSVQSGQFGFSATPGDVTVLSPPATATLRNEVELWSGEFNWWRQLRCNCMWRLEALGGVRFLRYRETATANNWVGLVPGSFFRNRATSDFYGAQIGGAFIVHGWPKVELLVSVKALLGYMQNDVEETDTAIVTGGATTDSTRGVANFGLGFEGEVAAVFRVLPRVGITAAYTILFLNDVSRATTTLDFSQAMTGSLQAGNATESNVIHSFFVGVRIDV